MKTTKRVLAMLLCVLMLLGVMPTQSLAAGAETDVLSAETNNVNVSGGGTASPTADGDAVKVEHDGTTTYYKDLQSAFDGFAPSNNTYGGTYVITLLGDTTGASKTLKYPSDGVIHVTLDLNGHTLSAYDTTKTVLNVTLKEGTATAPNTFTIKDSSGNNSGKITGGKGGVNVSGKNCTFIFEGGTITGNHGATKGGGINVGATTYFKMTGGVITGNSVTGTSSANTGIGGGVLVNYGSITGGSIYGNTANGGTGKQTGRGGGICTEITRTKGYSTLTIADGVVYGNTAENAGDDVMAQTNGSGTGPVHTLVIGTENWYVDGWNGKKASDGATDRYDAESPVAYTDGGFTDEKYKSIGLKYVAPAAEETAPEAPHGGSDKNVADGIYRMVCYTWDNHDGNGVSVIEHYPGTNYATNGEVKKNAEGKWTCDVTVRLKAVFEENYLKGSFSGHRMVTELPETKVFTAVWDSEKELWVWAETPVYELTCAPEKLTPAGDIFRAYLRSGNGRIMVDLMNVVYNESVALQLYSGESLLTTATLNATEYPGPATKSELTGSICVETWNDSDTWVCTEWTAWDHIVPTEIKLVVDGQVVDTHTLIYDANPDQGGTAMTEEDWVEFPGTKALPAAPVQSNVTDKLVAVICDSDPDRHETVYGKWYPQHCSTTSEVVWNAELGTCTVDVTIDSLYIMYVNQLEDANNGTRHELPDDMKSVKATLKWDETQQLWVPVEAIELHVTCKTAPDAPVHNQLKSYQIKVFGDVNGKETVYTVSLPEGSYTVGEVKGSREEGFTVDVTVTLADGDAFITTWLEKKAPGANYVYDWTKTEKTVTFTLKYNGDLNGTLYGNRHASNTNYDWVLSNGNHVGVVGNAYVTPGKPAAPTQSTVTDKLVTVICDTDEAHETVYGKWYPQNCSLLSDSEIVWNEELKAWTVDVRVDSMDWYYVHLTLEDAYNDIHHELVSSNYVDTTLVWDPIQNLWLPTEPIEVHAACKTAPDAPGYNSYIKFYQVKVFGDVNGEQKAWTTSIPEDGYTIGEVYGSREEGFFVDVTATISEGDIYQTTWIAKRNPGYFYNYDWTKTEKTVTFTLQYNGSLTGTLNGNSLDGKDWVLASTGKNFGVVAEAYLQQITCTVNLVIYRNGNTTTPYKTVSLGQIAKGETLDLTALDVSEYYTSSQGFEFEGWFNDGGWNQYKAGKNPAGLSEIYINGWTNIVCMVTDYQKVVVKSVVNGDKNTEQTIFEGKALYGENLVAWMEANVTIPEKTGYTADKWYNWDWYGHKYDDQRTITGWTNVYVDYQPNQYTLTLDPNGGKVDPATMTVTYDAAIGELPEATRSGYIFDGWVDAEGNEVTAETIYKVAGDSTITAKWIRHPGSGSGNVTKELFTIQCTVNHDHSWLCNWFGSHVKLVSGSVKWNEELGRWEAQAKIGSSMMSQINSTQPKRKYFGGITHHYDETNYVFDLYYDPNYTGLNSENKEVTGMWLPVEKYVVNVYCYTEPAAPSDTTIQKLSKLIWIRDAGNTKNYLKPTKLYANTYTVGEMYTKDGKFYVDLTITDLTPYMADFAAKYGEGYVIGEWEQNYTAKDFKFTLVYTGSTTDYKQDGTGWSVDASSYATTSEKNNGKTLWVTKQYTVTYTDGVEDKEVFADQVYTVNAMTETAKDKFTATATPAFVGETVRTGYTFAGWNPEWAEAVSGDVTYTAQWTANKYTLTLDANGGKVEPATMTVTYDAAIGELPVPTRTGYTFTGWADAEGKEVTAETVYTVAGDSTITAQWKANTYTLTLDANGGKVEPATMTVTYDAAIGELPVPTRTGYTFTGWADAEGKEVTAETVYTVADDSTITAQWKANTYTLILDANGGKVDPATVAVTYDAAIGELPVPTRTGYTFVAWLDAEGNVVNAETVYTATDNTTVTAKWSANECTITLDPNGGDVEPVTLQVAYETAIGELPVPSRIGYTFAGWTDKDGNEVTAETVCAELDGMTLTAQWKANTYTVTLDANGGELETKTVTATYDAAIGELPVPTRKDYTFEGWLDANGNKVDAEAVYKLAGETTLTASWKKKAVSPSTGDEFIIVLPVAVMILSSAAILVLLNERKKRAA